MLRSITLTLIALVALGGFLTDDISAQRRRDSGSGSKGAPRTAPTPRTRTPEPRRAPQPRVQTTPNRRAPQPRVQTPPKRREVKAPRVQTPPTRREVPTPRVQTPPTRREVPTPRVQTPPTRREVPTPRVTTPPSRREVPTPRVETPPSRREAPTPRVRTPSTRRDDSNGRVETPTRRNDPNTGSSRRDSSARVEPRSNRGSSESDRGTRRLDELKRYTERRGNNNDTRGNTVSPNTGRSGSNDRLGSGSVPGSGFSGSSRRGGTAVPGSNSTGSEPSTGLRPRNRTVFPDSPGSDRGSRTGTERSRDSYGRGGLNTVTPELRTRTQPARGRVAGERVSVDAPTPRLRGDGLGNSRLTPMEPAGAGGRGDRVDRSGSAGRSGSGGRRDLRAGYFRGSSFWGLDSRGHGNRHHDNGSFDVRFGYGGGRDYCGSYLYGASYSSYWDYWSFGIRTPYHLGYASPAHVYFGYQNDFRRYARYHFGYSDYLPCSRRSPYPFYRTRYWQPWYLDYWADVCPTYRTYHVIYEDYYVGEQDYYVETSDPYVDEEVLIPVGDIDITDYDPDFVGAREPDLAGGVPVAFQRSFTDSVPADLGFDELLAWGEEALFADDYLGAAEAFRRAAKLRWEDDYPKFQMALALFGAERYDLAYLALELGLDQNPAWLYRRFDLRDAFSSQEAFADRLTTLERYLIRNDRNDEARFLLGYLYYFSDNLFGARSVVRTLSETDPDRFRHLDILSREAEKRILREGR